MGAGASALPDKLSLENARQIAGEKFDIAIFKNQCDKDGFISRELFLQYEEKKREMQHASTMPTGIAKRIIQGDKLHQAESMRQLWRKATGTGGGAPGLNRPISVKDLATGFMLTKRAAWADPSTSPMTPNRKNNGYSLNSALTPVTSHGQSKQHTFPIEESITPQGKHNHHKPESQSKINYDTFVPKPIQLSKSVTSYDESMDSNDSLLQPGNSPSNNILTNSRSISDDLSTSSSTLTSTTTTTTAAVNKDKEIVSIEPLSSSPPIPALGTVPQQPSLRFNLAMKPLTLDLNAPPADRRGLTLMTDTAGTMKAAGKTTTTLAGGPDIMNDVGMKKFGSRREERKSTTNAAAQNNNANNGGNGGVGLSLKLDRADSFGDLLEGVDDVINVDLEDSFMMTPRKDRGTTLNVNLDLESSGQDQDKSMMFTDSGAINLKGVDLPIRDTGMVMLNSQSENNSIDMVNGGGGGLSTIGVNKMNQISSNSNSDNSESKNDTISIDEQKNGNKRISVVHERLPLQERSVRLERLGQGAAGIVYKAFDLEGLELVALKEIPIYEKGKRHQMVHELNSLYKNLTNANEQAAIASKSFDQDPQNKDQDQKNTTTMNEMKEDTIGSSHVVAFIDAFSNIKDATVNLMVEYMNGGSLQNIVDGGGCNDHTTLANIAKQSLLGLRFLHNTHNLHRDIKPANMLINYEGDVKVSDFGIIRKLEHEVEDEDDGMIDPGAKPKKKDADGSPLKGPMLKSAHTFVGTVTYMSPERINGDSYSTPSDVWSLGLSLMTCALGKIPLRTDKGYWSLLQCVRDEDPPTFPLPSIEDGEDIWSEDLRDFCRLTLIKDPAKRATCDELLKHPFLKRADYLINNNNDDYKIQEEEEEEEEETKNNDDDSEEYKNDGESKKDGDETSFRPRSESTCMRDEAKEEIGFVMREGGLGELDSMLKACYYHFESLYEKNRQKSLALLDNEASQASTPLKSLAIFLRKDTKPHRIIHGAKHHHQNSGKSGYDSLSRLASQLNLPVSVVRKRVDLLSTYGIDAISRKKQKQSNSNMKGKEERTSKGNVFFDTLDSEPALSPVPVQH